MESKKTAGIVAGITIAVVSGLILKYSDWIIPAPPGPVRQVEAPVSHRLQPNDGQSSIKDIVGHEPTGSVKQVELASKGMGAPAVQIMPKPEDPPKAAVAAADPPKKPVVMKPVVMGVLEPGINRAQHDLDGYGKSAVNAQLCAEMCRVNSDCDSMTYVVSLKTCWMKSGVPDPSSDLDMVSAVKVK